MLCSAEEGSAPAALLLQSTARRGTPHARASGRRPKTGPQSRPTQHTLSALQQMMTAGLCPSACERTHTCCADPAVLLYSTHEARAAARADASGGPPPLLCTSTITQPHSKTVSVLLAHWDSIYVPCTGASKNGEREGNSELKNTARRVCLPGCLGFCCTAHFCSGTACAARSSFSLD